MVNLSNLFITFLSNLPINHMYLYLADAEPSSLEVTWNFFRSGGVFMIPILGCSLVAVGVAFYKFMTLSKSLIIPSELESSVSYMEKELEVSGLGGLSESFQSSDTTLGRLGYVALSNAERSQAEVQEAVQSTAHEEIVKMSSGMPALEVVITIAPLIGLLGTASGLVLVFSDVGKGADSASVGQGIAMALNTTVAGLAVAVPTVVVHSLFNRKIETMAARLEVLMGKVNSACHQYVLRQPQ